MQLQNGLKVGDICFHSLAILNSPGGIVEIVSFNDASTSFNVKVKSDRYGSYDVYGKNLITLEQASHELYLLVKQAETLRKEVGSRLYSKYKSNEIN